MQNNERYEKANSARKKCVEDIINSQATKKIVVGGPGTGKTYLFKEALLGKKKCLTLTFVNALVDELSLELSGLSDVRTLHGFAHGQLKNSNKNIKVFPRLSKVIKEDAELLLNKHIDFDTIFHNMDDENENFKFYKERKDLYKYYGYSDIIYGIVRYYQKDEDNIPNYDLVVVDEFQDFNKLEVSLIDLLSERSPILIVGDDDQALYDFKSASTEHIRQRHNIANQSYAKFNLPFCSRSTRVIVDAANDIINSAKVNGLFGDRIEKQFMYFEDESKNKESDQNPKLVYSHAYDRQIPWFITNEIEKIGKQLKRPFSVLIISPTRNQTSRIVEGIRKKGFSNVQYVAKTIRKETNLLDGLKLLIEDKDDVLGWRIVAKHLLEAEVFKILLDQTYGEDKKNISDIVHADLKTEVQDMLKVLTAIKDNKQVDDEKLPELLRKMGLTPYLMEKQILKDELIPSLHFVGNRGLRKIAINATTVQGSKGLSSDYVFITHFDNRFFIKGKDKKKITDQHVCTFLVALTRASKRVYLISCVDKEEPTFLRWIEKKHIEWRNIQPL